MMILWLLLAPGADILQWRLLISQVYQNRAFGVMAANQRRDVR
jgi:hypothetical protein